MKITVICILVVCLPLCACSTARKLGTYGVGAAAGTAAGHYFSDGDPLWTAAGALGGTVLAAGANAMGDTEVKRAKEEGYAAGQGDAIRQHYWMLQSQQQASQNRDYGTENTYDITVPGSIDAYGVRRVPRDATLRIVE